MNQATRQAYCDYITGSSFYAMKQANLDLPSRMALVVSMDSPLAHIDFLMGIPILVCQTLESWEFTIVFPACNEKHRPLLGKIKEYMQENTMGEIK